MGTYYVAASHTEREYVDPASLGFCPKDYGCYMSDFAHLVCYLMFGRWYNGDVEFVSDESDPYDGHTSYTSYTDITREAAEAFNGDVEPMFKVPDEEAPHAND